MNDEGNFQPANEIENAMQNDGLLGIIERSNSWSCLLEGVEIHEVVAAGLDELLEPRPGQVIIDGQAWSDVDVETIGIDWRIAFSHHVQDSILESAIRILETKIKNLLYGFDRELAEEHPLPQELK